MDNIAHPHARRGAPLAAQIVTVVRSDVALARLAIGVVAIHVADDNFLQPQPGTSAGDHLVSGLVPIAVLIGAGLFYEYVCAGLRAALARADTVRTSEEPGWCGILHVARIELQTGTAN
jgi:hypothetical protein